MVKRPVRPRVPAAHLVQLLRVLRQAHNVLRHRLPPRLAAAPRAKCLARGQEPPEHLVHLGVDEPAERGAARGLLGLGWPWPTSWLFFLVVLVVQQPFKWVQQQQQASWRRRRHRDAPGHGQAGALGDHLGTRQRELPTPHQPPPARGAQGAQRGGQVAYARWSMPCDGFLFLFLLFLFRRLR